MNQVKNRLLSKLTAIVLTMVLVVGTLPMTALAEAYDPATGHENLELRFWEDEKPGVRFYINAAEKYLLESIEELGFGTAAGEWSAMDLLRGMYTGMDYINEIPADYFDKYIQAFEQAMIDANGTPHAAKYTEYSRLILALSSLGYDVHNVAPHFREGDFNSKVVNEEEGGIPYAYDIPLRYSVKNSQLYRQGINGPIWVLIAMNTGGYQFYTRDELEVGIDGTDPEIADKLSAFGVTSLEAEGKTVNSTTGKTTGYKGVATEGKQIEYILDKEITQKDGTVGGWALSGSYPDPDITGMAVQALTPYYLDEDRFNAAKENAYYDDSLEMPYTYDDLKQAVERAVYVMSLQQKDNGGFLSWGTVNSESVAQIIVMLTGLGMDPLSKNITLPAIGQTCNFIKAGEEQDGVITNNMIDNILTFWANGSGSAPDVGGFKHVTTGDDGGGGSGTTVNGMATDQAIYGLIAYDRFLNGANKLYDMSDMTGGEYRDMSASAFTLTYDRQGYGTNDIIHFSPYAVTNIQAESETADYTFVEWNTKADGTGVSYAADEKLSMPERDITLYGIYDVKPGTPEEVDAVIAKINAIGTVTLDSEAKITEARTAYNALTEAGKAIVTNYTTLTDAEAALSALKLEKAAVDAVIAKINAIGTVTLDSEAKITEARTAYNALADAGKALVTNYTTLTDAEAALSALKSEKAAVDAVIAKINAIGTVTLDSEARITEARTAYNALTEAGKAKVTNRAALTDAEAALKALRDIPRDAVDSDTGIVIVIDPSVVPENTVVNVKPIDDKTSEVYGKIEAALKNGIKESKVTQFQAYDITLTSDNAVIQPNGKITVKLPIPDGYDTSKLAVLKVLTDGTVKAFEFKIVDGYAVFETDSFSTYVLAETEKGIAPDTKPSPETGDTSSAVPFAGLPLAALACMAGVSLKFRKKAK